jgi:hypothetical protein
MKNEMTSSKRAGCTLSAKDTNIFARRNQVLPDQQAGFLLQ